MLVTLRSRLFTTHYTFVSAGFIAYGTKSDCIPAVYDNEKIPSLLNYVNMYLTLKQIIYIIDYQITAVLFMQIFDDIKTFLEANKSKKPIIAVVGPTASGKTALSIEIAKKFNGEIISTDSRQVYKYMDIGTDKIPESKREGIRHHMIDICDPSYNFTLSEFKRLSIRAINEIHTRQKLPILAGGTGLYLNTIIENYEIPKVPPQFDLRQKLARYYEQYGAEALHDVLKEKDPASAESIHPNNVRYVIRAIEVAEARANGLLPKQSLKGEKLFSVFTIGIDWPRDILYERINRRVHDQVDRGIINEIKTLLLKGYDEKLPSMSSLGYPELIQYIKGNCTLEEALENIQQSTRNYCKRQLTWFRRYSDITWVSGNELEKHLNS